MSFVNREQSLHNFEFNNHSLHDYQIDSISGIELGAFVLSLNGDLGLMWNLL